MSFDPLQLPALNPTRSFDVIDPLDGRYFDAEISRYLSEGARIRYQAYVEAALAQTLAEFGVCGAEAANEIEQAARAIDPAAVAEEETRTKHDVKALVNTIKSAISDEAKPYVHMTATSYDIVSTASAVQYRDGFTDVVLPALRALLDVLLAKAEQYAETVQIGRTHGQHGVPITFGFALAQYISRIGNSTRAIQELAGQLEGKFSGAVGAYNASKLFVDDPLKFEASVLAKLGLKPAEISTQIVPPESLARLFDELELAAGAMANLATDLRHLQRSEIAEIREQFEEGQTGSSTMAHKRNPISFENVASLYKQVLAQGLVVRQNLISEHQRDLTDSASARFYPVMVVAAVQMAKRLAGAMAKLEVDNDAMQHNLGLSGGAIAAEPLYLLLAKHGHTQAHEEAKRVAHLAMDNGQSYAEAVKQDEQLSAYWDKFSDEERQILENPSTYYTGLAADKTRAIISEYRS